MIKIPLKHFALKSKPPFGVFLPRIHAFQPPIPTPQNPKSGTGWCPCFSSLPVVNVALEKVANFWKANPNRGKMTNWPNPTKTGGKSWRNHHRVTVFFRGNSPKNYYYKRKSSLKITVHCTSNHQV